MSKEVGHKFLYSNDVQARDNILDNELLCQCDLAEVSCIETIVPVKQQILPMPSTILFQIQLILLKERVIAETATGYASGYANACGLSDAVFIAYT